MNCLICSVLLFTQISLVVTINLAKASDRQNLALNKTRQNFTEVNDFKDKIESSTAKTVMKEDKRVYLEDVFYSLKNQDWGKDEEACLNDILFLLKGLQNFSLWAVWEWDSISSEPNGLLFGSKYQLGNFDECLGAPWSSSHPELQTQYCLTNIKLERNNKTVKSKLVQPFDPYQSAIEFMQFFPKDTHPLNELVWGLCVPASCKPKSVKRLMTTMLARSHIGISSMMPKIEVDEKCQKSQQSLDFDSGFYVYIGVIGLLAAIAILCTILNLGNEDIGERDSYVKKIIKAFSIKENAKDLLRMSKEGLEVLYGIKILTICFIVMDHQLAFFNTGPISNARDMDKDSYSTAAVFVIHDDLLVDTFFLLSGMLTATKLMSIKILPNPLFIILMRYVRLVVAFAVVVFFMATVLPYAGSGPVWPLIEKETGACQRNWWLSLLMLTNYIKIDDRISIVNLVTRRCIQTFERECISCDFHFFVIVVLIYWLYTKHKTPALILTSIIGIASIIVPGVINYMNGLRSVQLITYELLVNVRKSNQYNLTYIKSHTRFAAYLIGFITGYIFMNCKASGQLKRISKKWSIIGALTGLTIMLSIMVIGPLFLRQSYYSIEGSIYAALDRPVWAVGLAMLVLCCALGHVPLITGFLSWYPWVPLSRLTYGLFLTHTLIIFRNTFVARSPMLNDYDLLTTMGLGVIFWGCIAALVIWLFVEAPVNNFLALLLRSKVKKIIMESETSTANLGNVNGHSHSNLVKQNIQYTSKV